MSDQADQKGNDAIGKAIEAVNCWRGHVLQCFCQAEAAVGEALLDLAAAAPADVKIGLRPMGGQRFEDLKQALGEKPFTKIGDAASAALEAFCKHQALRGSICHGTAKIFVDRRGRWLVVLKMLAFKNKQEDRSRVYYEQREAEVLLADLVVATQALLGALQAMRSKLKEGS